MLSFWSVSKSFLATVVCSLGNSGKDLTLSIYHPRMFVVSIWLDGCCNDSKRVREMATDMGVTATQNLWPSLISVIDSFGGHGITIHGRSKGMAVELR